MTITSATTFEVSTSGVIGHDVIERAQERLNRVGTHCREPVSHVELRVTDLSEQHRASAEATFIIKHGPVRAHADAATVGEAVDLMIRRLRRRVDRQQAKLHRIGAKKHDGVAAPHEWHHGDVDGAPRHAPPLSSEDVPVIRRATFATRPMRVDEALCDLQSLGDVFYLFEDVETSQTCLISQRTNGSYALRVDGDRDPTVPDDVAFDKTKGPAVLNKEAAQRLLATGDEPFVFYRPTGRHEPQVLYRRNDGALGIVELRLEPSL